MKKDEMPSFDSFNDLVDVSEEMAGLMELANEHHYWKTRRTWY